MLPDVAYRTVNVDGLDIFYREAGPQDAPTVLLLHGFPTSSHMFRNLIPARADEFTCSSCHLVQHRSRLRSARGKPPICADCA